MDKQVSINHFKRKKKPTEKEELQASAILRELQAST